MRYLSENGKMVDKLKLREGMDSVPRQDSGRDRAWTIGHGHNLDANPLSSFLVETLLTETKTKLRQDGKMIPGLIERVQTRNLFSQPITDWEAHIVLCHDMDIIQDDLVRDFPIMQEVFNKFEIRASGILSMAFQMGCPRLKGFKKMWANLEIIMLLEKDGYGVLEDWETVVKEALDSVWARNHVGRSKDVAYRLRYNDWQE